MKRYVNSSTEPDYVDSYFSDRTKSSLKKLTLNGKFDKLVNLIKSDPLCAPISSISSDRYTINYRDHSNYEVGEAVERMYKVLNDYVAENSKVNTGVADDKEIYDEAVFARISKVLDNLNKYQNEVDRIADEAVQYYIGSDEAWYADLRTDIYQSLREFVSKTADVDYLNYYLGDDNYDRLYKISSNLAEKFANKYGITLMYEDD